MTIAKTLIIGVLLFTLLKLFVGDTGNVSDIVSSKGGHGSGGGGRVN